MSSSRPCTRHCSVGVGRYGGISSGAEWAQLMRGALEGRAPTTFPSQPGPAPGAAWGEGRIDWVTRGCRMSSGSRQLRLSVCGSRKGPLQRHTLARMGTVVSRNFATHHVTVVCEARSGAARGSFAAPRRPRVVDCHGVCSCERCCWREHSCRRRWWA